MFARSLCVVLAAVLALTLALAATPASARHGPPTVLSTRGLLPTLWARTVCDRTWAISNDGDDAVVFWWDWRPSRTPRFKGTVASNTTEFVALAGHAAERQTLYIAEASPVAGVPHPNQNVTEPCVEVRPDCRGRYVVRSYLDPHADAPLALEFSVQTPVYAASSPDDALVRHGFSVDADESVAVLTAGTDLSERLYVWLSRGETLLRREALVTMAGARCSRCLTPPFFDYEQCVFVPPNDFRAWAVYNFEADELDTTALTVADVAGREEMRDRSVAIAAEPVPPGGPFPLALTAATTPSSGVAAYANGALGAALSLNALADPKNGNGAYARVPDALPEHLATLDVDEGALSLWIRPSRKFVTHDRLTLVDYSSATSPSTAGWQLSLRNGPRDDATAYDTPNDGAVVFTSASDSLEIFAGGFDVFDDMWHHVYLSRSADDGVVRLFVDGRAFADTGDIAADGSARLWSAVDASASPQLTIGARRGAAGAGDQFVDHYKGELDEFVVFERAQTDDSIVHQLRAKATYPGVRAVEMLDAHNPSHYLVGLEPPKLGDATLTYERVVDVFDQQGGPDVEFCWTNAQSGSHIVVEVVDLGLGSRRRKRDHLLYDADPALPDTPYVVRDLPVSWWGRGLSGCGSLEDIIDVASLDTMRIPAGASYTITLTDGTGTDFTNTIDAYTSLASASARAFEDAVLCLANTGDHERFVWQGQAVAALASNNWAINVPTAQNDLEATVPPSLWDPSGTLFTTDTGNCIVEFGPALDEHTTGVATVPASFFFPGQQPTLEVVHLGNVTSNVVGGVLPSELANSDQWRELLSFDNAVSGTVPHAYGRFKNRLTHIELASSSLSGPMPSSFEGMTDPALQRLLLQHSAIGSGLTPAFFEGLSTGTQFASLYVYDTPIGGELPSEIGLLRHASMQSTPVPADELRLSFNPHTATIPTLLGRTDEFSFGGWLDLSNTQITGRLPDELPNMCNGTDTGATPDCPSGLRWYNMLGEGPLPSTLGRNDYEVCGFVDLDVSGLGASTTSLGDLPVELFTRTSQELAVGCGWESIELRDAAVTSPLPREVGQLAGIEVLAMHRTELPGPLPAELGDVFTAADGLSEAARSPVVSLHENAIDGDLPRDFMPRVGHAIRVAIAPSVDYPMSLTEQLRDVCVSSSSNVGECSVANTVYFRFGSLYSPSDNKCLQPSLLSQTNVEEVSWMLDAAGSPCRQKDQPRWRYTAAGQFEALSLVAQQPTGKCLVYTLNNGAPVFRERPCGDRGAAALLAGDGRFSRNEFEFATLDDVRGWGALSHSSSMEKMFHSQFDVRDNLLTGSLEFEIAFNRWDVFDVSHNQLSGELAAHDFGASLWYDLSDNSFSGELPFYFKANVHSLASETLGSIDPTLDAVVDVSNNAFTGQVPYPLDYASWYSPVAGDAAGRCSFTGNQFGCARNIDVLAGWTEASDCQFDQNVVRCLATTPHTPDDAPGYTNGQDFNAPTFHTPIAYELPQFVTWEATEDATLFEPGEDSVVGAAGAASSLVVGFVTDRNDLDDGTTVRTMVERRAIIRFDSESISRSGGRFVEQFTEGVGVRAQLSLGVDVFVADPTWAQNGAIEFSVHEVVDNAANSEELWTEGTSNDTACSPSAEQCKYATVVADGVSWVHTSFVSEAWGTQGGTFKQAPVATFSLSSIDSMGTDYQVLLENDALDELVRKWLRYPELNRGIIVRLSTLFHGDASDRAAEEASLPNLPPTSGREVFVSLASRENDSSALRPQVSFRVDTADDGTFFTNFEPQGANAAKIPDQWAGDWAVSSNTSDTDELSPLNEAVLTSGATERRMWHEAGRHAFLVGDAGDEQAVQVPARSSQQFDVLYDAGIGEELGQYEAGGANDFAVGRFAGRRRRALMSFNLAPMASVDRTRIADAWVVLTAKDQAGARTAQPQCRELFETSVAPYSVQCPNGIGPVRILSATYGNVTAAPPTCGDEPQVGNACVFDLTAALQAKCPAQQTDCEIQNADIPNEEACVNELMSSGDRAFHVRYECVYENPNGANSQQRLQLWENADTWVSGSTRGKCNAKFLATPDDVGPQNDRREATFKGHQCYEWFDTPVGGTAPSATWTRRAESLPWTSGVGGGSPVGDEPVAESTLHTTVSAQARDAEYAQTVFRSDALTALVRQWALSTDAQARGLVLRDADEDDASLGADGLATLFFSSEAGETRADQYEMQVRGGAPVGRLVNGDFAGFRPRLIVRYGTVNAEGITALSDESGGTVDFDASFASTTSNAPTPTNTYPDLLQWPVITFDSTAQAATPHRSDVPTHAWQRNPVPFASRDHQGAPNAASPPTPEYTLYSDGVARSVVGRGSLNNGDASYAGSSVSVRTPDEWYLSRGDSSGAAGGTQVVDVTTLSASSFSIHPNTTLTAPSVAPVAAPCAHVHGSAALHFSGDDVFAFGEREEEFRLRVPSDINFRNYLFRSKFTEMWANGVAPAGHMQVMGAWVYATYPEATVTESGEYQTLFGLANRQTGSIRFGWDLELAEGVLRLCSHVGCTAGTDQVPKETWIHVFVAVRGDQGYFGWGTSDSDGQVYKFASSAPQEFEIDKTVGSAGARAVLGGHLERGDDDDDGSSSTLSSAARQPFFGLIDDVWFNLASEELLGFSLSDASTMSYDNWARMFAGHVPAAADGTCGRDNRGPPSNVRSFAESQVWLATDPSVPIWDASNSGYVFSLERQVNPVYFEHYHRDVASDATRREHCMATLRVVDASYHENGASDGKLQKPRYLPHGLVPGRLLASRELSELECSAYSDDWQHAVLSVSASRVMARMTLHSSSSTDIVEFNVFDASVAGPFHLGFFQSPEAVGGGDGSAPQPMRVDNVGVRRGVQMPWGFELSD